MTVAFGGIWRLDRSIVRPVLMTVSIRVVFSISAIGSYSLPLTPLRHQVYNLLLT